MPSGVYERTEEHKKKLRVPHSGSGVYERTEYHRLIVSESRKGLKASKKTRQKMSKSHMDVKLSKAHRQSISKSRMGIKFIEEHKQNIPEGRKGILSWRKGLTKETDARVAKQSKPRSKKVKVAMRGHSGVYVRTEECNKVHGEGQEKRWAKLTEEQRKEYSKPLFEASRKLLKNPKYLKKLLRRRIPTSLEKKFQGIVDKHNLPYKYAGDGSFVIGGKNPDFINTNNKKIAIEVYARYFKLRHGGNIERWKEERRKIFNEYGWEIIFFNEIEVNEKNILEKIL